jgi:UDPglucose 6-dehydrogenase
MKIVVMGAGFVGLTHAAVCAELGHEVVAYDIDARRIAAYASGAAEAIERYVNEPGLARCIAAQLGKNLSFTASPDALAEALGARVAGPGADVVFLCVPTPSQPSGATDRAFYLAAARQVGDLLARRASLTRVAVVNKSTVPIGTARLLAQILRERGARNVGAVSNPEFLPQGNALAAARKPDRMVVGADMEEDFVLLRRVYARIASPSFRIPGGATPQRSGTAAGAVLYLETSPETAEAIKYVANALLFTYISFWNGVGARLGERFPNVDMDGLRLGVTSDDRISTWGAQVGIGAGGSCFGKDIRSLIHQLESVASSTELLLAVHRINELQKVYMVERAAAEARFEFAGKTVAVLGLAFKQGTNDMRDSAALSIIEALLARNVAAVRAHDPVVDERTVARWLDPRREPMFERVSHHRSAEDALRGSDVLFIATDWKEYRSIGGLLREVVQPPYLIIDGRRMLVNAPDLVARGYSYLPAGGPLLGYEHLAGTEDAADAAEQAAQTERMRGRAHRAVAPARRAPLTTTG